MARALGARNVPRLVFRHDGLTPRQQQLEDVFRRLDEQEAEERLQLEQLEQWEPQGEEEEQQRPPQSRPW